MLFGISFLPDATPRTKSAIDYYTDALELADIAEQSGLHCVKMTEHYLGGYGGYCPSPLTFLAAVAARTKKIRLMTGCILPVFHHPVQTAAETAMVDALSKGRIEVGFARAYLPYEFDCFGISLDESRARFTACLETIIRLWTEPQVTVETPFFSFKNASSLPLPVQTPHPPIWVAAVRSRQSFAWIGEKGFNLLVTSSMNSLDELRDNISIYRESFQSGWAETGKRSRVTISLPLYIDESDSRAIEEGSRFLHLYHEVWADAVKSWEHVHSQDYPGYTGISRAIKNINLDSMRRERNAIIGSPARIIDSIHYLCQKLDLDQIIWQIDFGAMPGELAKRSLRLFVDRVLPQLSQTVGQS